MVCYGRVFLWKGIPVKNLEKNVGAKAKGGRMIPERSGCGTHLVIHEFVSVGIADFASAKSMHGENQYFECSLLTKKLGHA